MVGELLFASIARDQREEVRRTAIALGPQDASEPLCFLLPGPEGARDLDEHVGVGQVVQLVMVEAPAQIGAAGKTGTSGGTSVARCEPER